MIDEIQDLNSMIECRARMERSELSMWMQRCRSSVGDLHFDGFYGGYYVMYKGTWGNYRYRVDQLQIRGFWMFIGVGRYHPRAAL